MLQRTCCRLAAVLLLAAAAQAQQTAPAPRPISFNAAGGSYGADERGNRIPDFSYAGYRAGESPIPMPPATVVLEPIDGDDIHRLQRALDSVGLAKPDANDHRGTVLLKPGRYEISGGLVISASGVVLRGSGPGDGGTTIVTTGTDRRTAIRILGRPPREPISTTAIASAYVPVGATSFAVEPGDNLKAGDRIFITRPSTAEWIKSIGMDDFGGDRHGPSWRAGTRDLVWDRTIVKVDGNSITIDAPITTAIDQSIGGGTVAKYDWPQRVTESGVENLRLESQYNAAQPKNEDHAWCGVVIENSADVWVRQVTFRYFVSSAVAVWESAKRVTVEDCKSLAPVSEIGGGRRIAFITSGQQVLMQRLWSEDARHDFVTGLCAAGPNAFVQCQSLRSTQDSGGVDSWSSGTLFDNVRIDGHRLGFRNRSYEYAGAGWNGANSVLWNCHAAVIDCWRPPGAQNWSFGSWAEFSGDGYWAASNEASPPASLYYAQLAERLGAEAATRAQLLPWTAGSGLSAEERAAERSAAPTRPETTMNDWIDAAATRNPIDIASTRVDSLPDKAPIRPGGRRILSLTREGLLLIGDAPAIGGRAEIPWWRGSTRRSEMPMGSALTRFVPGRTGPGYTDNLADVVAGMVSNRQIAIEQHPPLWYDRRRDDHERIRRMDGNVVAPFYEWPYARSGDDETAWDGLSKYDLTRFNPWYFNRLREFAGLAEIHGVLLINQHYFQHSILEAGAHYADYPWRPANNINNVGFPEPPVYIGDKYIFMAPAFYDVSNPDRRELHRKYIRHSLDAFADQSNVIHGIGEEFTGPLPFVQMWVDTIAEWKKESAQLPVISLAVTKDVQDAILADPARAAAVDVIDIRFWWYATGPGDAFLPIGGENLAPRGWVGRLRPKPPTFAGVARAVREYRSKFPSKAVIFSARAAEDDTFGWATLVAGGSLPAIRGNLDPELLRLLPSLRPLVLPDGQWALADRYGHTLLASVSDAPVVIDLPGGVYVREDIDPRTSNSTASTIHITGRTEFKRPGEGVMVVWLRPKSAG